jgi:hypothetical protein
MIQPQSTMQHRFRKRPAVNWIKEDFSRDPILLLTMGALFIAAQGCHSRNSSGVHEAENKQPGSVQNPAKHHFDGGTYCVQAITQGPPVETPIHFSYRETHSDGSAKDFEADLLGDKFDLIVSDRHPATDFDREHNTVRSLPPIPIHDGFAENTTTEHVLRTDQSAWQSAANNVALGGTPWGLFIGKSEESQVDQENVNGYDTIKYTVDTTHETALEKSALLMAGNLKDYNITGTAWILKSANCVLKYDIVYEEEGTDGKTEKTHYTGAVARK